MAAPHKPLPTEVSGETGVALAAIPTLSVVPVMELRALNFPYPGDETDVFTLKTDGGTGYLDQGTGALLGWNDLTVWERVSETIYMLHTGQGASLLGLVLGLMALGIPVMGATGLAIWLAGRRGRPRIRGNQPAGKAETILLVGSESGSTWGFAATLHRTLSAAGQRVHVASMAAFDSLRYARGQRIIILAATYGDGDATASARGFLDRLAGLDHAPDMPLAVLGFGERSFPAYCAFAEQVVAIAGEKGWSMLLPFDTIDRQSPQEFARWGHRLGAALDIQLELIHEMVLPETQTLRLISREDYGSEVQAPTTILRFSMPGASLWQRLMGKGFERFDAGDLLGILPEGSTVPRLYSLASSRKDGFVEIVVKKHPSGLCSGQLTALEPGDTVTGLYTPQPGFQAGTRQQAADPDRRRYRHRSPCRHDPGQYPTSADPPVLRNAPPGQ